MGVPKAGASRKAGGPIAGHCFQTYVLMQSGQKWISEMDAERHFAADCKSWMSGNSSETLKSNTSKTFLHLHVYPYVYIYTYTYTSCKYNCIYI